ncbi:MAG TPA: sodium-translocating pyrophosphatase [Dehalococcoidia bacterium]|jgi:K(+)-stimulated pyrophosphate-energized sodium pump|nr:sodium-translocating pyrophosphatase [Dehalococcoidia bacterium]
MELVWMVPVTGALAALFAVWLAYDVLRRDTGTEAMQEIAGMIFEGAMAFLSRQYRTIAILAVLTAIAVGVIVGAISEGVKPIIAEQGQIGFGDQEVVGRWEEGLLTGIAFLVGAFCSGLAGYIGMFIAVRSNVRTAAAAQKSLKEAITVSLRGGAVSGFLVVALSLLGVSGIFLVYSRILDNPPQIAPFLIVGFGFGASFVALFAQLGGGIYTKAADVGADLVGKVEAGIPEDDPRNAAVVADLVGDNVGDCAGRGADLFESMSAENIGAMILGVAIYVTTGDIEWIMFPLVLRSFGILATIAGLISVPFFADDDPHSQQDPMTPLNMGYYIVSLLSVAGLFVATYVMLDDSWYWFFFCGITGILTGIAFVYITQYYTAGSWRPVREIAEASRTGPATNVIIGTAVGFETTALTAISIGLALVVSFVLGSQADIAGVPDFTTGIFGTAVATMGMLMSAAYILSMDTFGPITDNAGGITEMSGAPESAREITDKLDAVGNTTKALTKGYAVASAGLAAFLLFSAYLDKVKERLEIPLTQELPIDLANVDVFVGGLLGVMLVFLFSSLAIRAVGNAAGAIIEEVRRQFRADPGIMAGTSRPDYAAAVDITARAALREMILPGILAVSMPVVVGLIFRFTRDSTVVVGGTEYLDSSGWLAVSGVLIVGTIGGIMMATVLNNGGGAWDNAKKFIESGGLKDEQGNVLGKGSEPHKAAVVGDTIGDPFKDTAGPSLHVLIKLLATITLVLAPLFIVTGADNRRPADEPGGEGTIHYQLPAPEEVIAP